MLYFSTDKKFEYPFAKSEEGLHFVDNLKLLKKIKPQLRNKKYDYSIDYTIHNPLIIDGDILLWNSRNIAELLLCKLEGANYPSAFITSSDINPEDIHCDLTEEDRPILEYLFFNEANESSFHLMMLYLKSKGYDCIEYMIYEGDRKSDKAYILDNNNYTVKEVV